MSEREIKRRPTSEWRDRHPGVARESREIDASKLKDSPANASADNESETCNQRVGGRRTAPAVFLGNASSFHSVMGRGNKQHFLKNFGANLISHHMKESAALI